MESEYYKNLIHEEVFNQTNQFIGVMENDMTIKYVNRTLLNYIGMSEEQVIGLAYWELPLWDHSEELQNKIMFSIEKIYLGESVEFQTTCPNKEGHMRDIDFYIKPVFDESKEIVMLITMGYDVTESKLKESALARAENELKMFFEFSPNGFFIEHLDEKLFLDEDTLQERVDYIFQYEKLFLFNDALLEQLEVTRERLRKEGVYNILKINETHRKKIYTEMIKKKSSEFTVKMAGKNIQKTFECSCAPLIEENQYTGSFGVIRDVTEKKKIEQELIFLATKDSLTGIDNRRNYLNLVKNKINEEIARKTYPIFLMIDVDNFKKINDNYGHDMGDRVLIEITKEMSKIIDESGYLGRLGGEEFSAFLFNQDGKGIQLAEKIRRSIEEITVEHGNIIIQFTVSIGMTFLNSHIDVDEALRCADKALYKAKNSGKNKVVVYEKR